MKFNIFNNKLFLYSKDLIQIQKIIDILIAFIFSNLTIYKIYQVDNLNILLGIINILTITIVFDLSNLYKSYKYSSLFFLTRRLCFAFLISNFFSLTIYFLFFNQPIVIDRGFIITYFIYFLSFFIFHIIGRLYVRNYRQRKDQGIKVLFWGDYESAKFLINNIRKHKYQGYKIKAWFSSEKITDKRNLKNMNFVKGGLKDLKEWISRNSIDLIIFSDDITNKVSCEELVMEFGDVCKRISYMPSWYKSSMFLNISHIADVSIFNLWGSELSGFKLVYKRFFDLIFSIIIMFFTAPIFFLISILIIAESKGPIFFRQNRYGLDGNSFKCIKFRTMYVLEQGDSKNLKQASKDDPRVTKIGKFLRKWSLDELPQFINVILGEMSIVGPRPHAVIHNIKYRKKIPGYMQRHLLKPGITGLAQVKGFRGETKLLIDMENRINADLEYQREWNFFTDFYIVLKTIFKLYSEKAY